MKKFLYSIAALSLVLTGCQKNLHQGGGIDNDQAVIGEPTTVTFSLSSAATKADTKEAGTLNENKVNRVDAFVFNADGTLDGYVKVDNPATITGSASVIQVKATTGKNKRFVVIVNAATRGDDKFTDDEMEKVEKISDLNKVERVFQLRNNTLGGFQMYGNEKENLHSGDNPITVQLNRAVSRVKIDKITRNFDVPSLAAQTFKVKKIYLSNVSGSVANVVDAADASNDGKYFGTFKTAVGDVWYNKYAQEADHTNHPYDGYIDLTADVNTKSLTQIDIADEKQTLAQNAYLEPENGYRLYAMPNDVMPAYAAEDDTDAKCLLKEQALQSPNPWAPSLTKLVIETELAGKTYYYAIPIVKRTTYPEGKISEGIGYNETFNFKNIVLTRAGSEDPDTPVSTSNVIFDLQIQPWTVQAMATDVSGDFKI